METNITVNKKVNKTKFSTLRLIFFVIVAAFILRTGYSLFIKHARTEMARFGVLESSENVTGYIIKNEAIVQSTIDGQLKSLAKEGAKVPKGINVATVIKDSSSQQAISDKIKKIDDEIAEIKNNSQSSNIFAGDAQKLDTEISTKMKEVNSIAASGSIERLSDLKGELNDLINKKLIVTGEDGFAGTNIQAKLKEKENYIASMNMAKIDIPSGTSGILSFKLDGYEQKLAPNMIKNLTSKDLEKISPNSSDEIPSKVKVGQPVVKIINNFEWYIACVMKTANVNPLKENDSVKIALNDGNNIPAKVYSIKNENNGNSVVTLVLNSNLEQFYGLRKVDLKIIKRSYEGIKLPSSSLVVKGNKRGVLIVDKGVTKFKEVELEGFDEKFIVVNPDDLVTDKRGIALYDEVITNPLFVSEDTLVR